MRTASRFFEFLNHFEEIYKINNVWNEYIVDIKNYMFRTKA